MSRERQYIVKSKFSFRHFYLNFLVITGMVTGSIYGLSHPRQMIVVKNGVEENGLIICYILFGLGLLSFFYLLITATVVIVSTNGIVLQHIFSQIVIPKEAIVR